MQTYDKVFTRMYLHAKVCIINIKCENNCTQRNKVLMGSKVIKFGSHGQCFSIYFNFFI